MSDSEGREATYSGTDSAPVPPPKSTPSNATEFVWGINHNGKQVAVCSTCHEWFVGWGPEVRVWTLAHSKEYLGW